MHACARVSGGAWRSHAAIAWERAGTPWSRATVRPRASQTLRNASTPSMAQTTRLVRRALMRWRRGRVAVPTAPRSCSCTRTHYSGFASDERIGPRGLPIAQARRGVSLPCAIAVSSVAPLANACPDSAAAHFGQTDQFANCARADDLGENAHRGSADQSALGGIQHVFGDYGWRDTTAAVAQQTHGARGTRADTRERGGERGGSRTNSLVLSRDMCKQPDGSFCWCFPCWRACTVLVHEGRRPQTKAQWKRHWSGARCPQRPALGAHVNIATARRLPRNIRRGA